jgi:hypothetical protein
MWVEVVPKKGNTKTESYKNRKVIYGGFRGPMTWEFYLSGFEDDLHDRLEILRLYIIERESDMDIFRNPRFSEENYILFGDGSVFTFSFRAWGDFMAAVQNNGLTHKEFYGI